MAKLKIPEGMLNAFTTGTQFGTIQDGTYRHNPIAGLEAALQWLAENPVVPPKGWGIVCLHAHGGYKNVEDRMEDAAVEWQRRMFLAPEPEIPEEIRDLMWSEALYFNDPNYHLAVPKVNETILQAFIRGQKYVRDSIKRAR